MPDCIKWKPISESRYWEMLGMLPPAAQTGFGFLLGEPYSYRECSVTRRGAQTFHAFAELNGAFYEASYPLTCAEFRATRRDDIASNVANS